MLLNLIESRISMSHFSIEETNTMTKQHRKETFYRHWHYDNQGGYDDKKQPEMVLAQWLSISWDKQSRGRNRELTWKGKAQVQGQTSSHKIIPYTLSQTVSPTGDQIFKQMNLWWPFLFKPVHTTLWPL